MLSHHFPNSIAYLSDEQMFAIPPVNATSVAINRNQIYETLEEIEAMLLCVVSPVSMRALSSDRFLLTVHFVPTTLTLNFPTHAVESRDGFTCS